MIEIFIPVLWVCINAKCQFMQAQTHFIDEERCLQSLDEQKQHLIDLIEQSGVETTIMTEGICAYARIKARVEKQVMENYNE
jgi:hypothetical protein